MIITGRYELILMDCNMPVMDGYEACAFIRMAEKKLGLKATPVIALTAYAWVRDGLAWGVRF